MAYTAEELAADDDFHTAMLQCIREMLAIYRESPRIASIFAAQQRWLMAHAGFALHFGYPGDHKQGLYSGRFIDFVIRHKIASRNTAAAFVQEMLAYRFLRPVPGTTDRRTRMLEPTETALQHFAKWLIAHLLVLDSIDGGARAEMVSADPSLIGKIQPLLAKSIIETDLVRDPGATFSLFNWANSGGLVMDYLITRLPNLPSSTGRVFLGPMSLREIRNQFMISNTHLKRLLTQATELGSIGWTQPYRKGDFWLSHGFIMEYWNYQAAKFALVDAAAEAALGPATARLPQVELFTSAAP